MTIEHAYSVVQAEKRCCQGCGRDWFLSMSHLVRRSRRKDLEEDPRNITVHCLSVGRKGCHEKWESNDYHQMSTLNDFRVNMATVKELDPGFFSFLLSRFRGQGVDELTLNKLENMGLQDELRNARGGQSQVPRLDVSVKLGIKEKDGKPSFHFYDKNLKNDVFFTTPIKGILVGEGMVMEAFCANENRSYTTAMYASKSNVALFGPSPNGYSKVCSGTLDECEAWLKKNTNSQPKKRRVFLVLTEKGLVSVTTNMSIAIDQVGQLGDSIYTSEVVLKPALYDPSDKGVSNKCKEILKKLAVKNPPKYASVSTGDPIDEGKAEKWGASKHISDYVAWRKWATGGTGKVDKPTEEPAVKQDPDQMPF
jgi:hypothetical protein